MTYLQSNVIYILIGLMGLGYAVHSKEFDESELESMLADNGIDTLELQSRIFEMAGKSELHGKAFQAKGTVIKVVRGRAVRFDCERYVYVLGLNEVETVSSQKYFWVRLKESVFLASGISVDGPINVAQSSDSEIKPTGFDYDLFYTPEIIATNGNALTQL